jgi:hypothetical protein
MNRLVMLAISALVLACPLGNAQAGFLKNTAKLAAAAAAGDALIIKSALKGKPIAPTKVMKFQAVVGVCALKAATSHPCKLF